MEECREIIKKINRLSYDLNNVMKNKILNINFKIVLIHVPKLKNRSTTACHFVN